MIKLNDNNINAFSANKIYLGDNVVFQGFKRNDEGKIDKIVGKVVTTVDNQSVKMAYSTNHFSGYHINELNIDATSNTYTFPTVGEYTIEYTTAQPLDEFYSMVGCFSSCSSLASVELPELPNVSDMYYCFYKCSSITSITLPSSLHNVKNMQGCFRNCSSLTSISLPELPLVTNMSNCFYQSFSLQSVTFPSSLPEVNNMIWCFADCSALSSITFPSSLPNVTDMSDCFQYCSSLTSIHLPELQNVTNIGGCFNGCLSLASIDFGLNTLQNVSNMDYCFVDCASLNHIRCTQDAKDKILSFTNNSISNTPIGKGQGTWEIIG